jgi:glycosyltransferase involved in cell wall biosynthesis
VIRNRSIICFANDWHSDPTSKQHIMRVLGRENFVLWVNSIGLRNPSLEKQDISRIFNKLKSAFRGIEKINDNFYVLTPIVIPFHKRKFVKSINSFLLRLLLKHYIRKFNMKNIIYWSYLPNVGYVVRKMNADFVLYHCVDEWSNFSFIDSDIIREEKILCEISDLVLASARELYNSRKQYNSNIHYLPHGVDYDHFHSARSRSLNVPEDMKDISGPIAGFFGLIHEWVDLDLLHYVIKSNPGVSFVFIGKQSVDVDFLKKFPNCHFLGQKPYSELVSYARLFDIGLIPFKVNELTINVNPIKLKEYLALGIPVISVNIPEVHAYRHVVRIADGYEEYDRLLKEEISGNHLASAEEIDAAAIKETWDQKVEEISDLIEKIRSAR